jgi:hypothetical protein
MNTTDLRDELTALAEPVTAPATIADGVASKITTIRRRRTGLAAAGAGLAVAAIAVGVLTTGGYPAPVAPAGAAPSTAPMIGSDGMPFRSVPDGAGDVVKDGLRYRARVADDTLAAGAIGDPGQGQFSLRWTPTTTHVSFAAECYLPGLSDEKARGYMVSLGLDGTKGAFGSQCSAHRPTERDLPVGGGTPGEPGQGWSELTVGQDASLRVQLVDAKTMKPASVDGAVLTGAVYDLGEQQLVKDGSGAPVAALPTVLEHQGYRYTLKGVNVAPLRSWRDLTVGLPSGPAMVSWGSAGKDLTGGGSGDEPGMRLTGLRDGVQGAGWGAILTQPVPADSAPRLTLSATGTRPDHGAGFLAVYTLEK